MMCFAFLCLFFYILVKLTVEIDIMRKIRILSIATLFLLWCTTILFAANSEKLELSHYAVNIDQTKDSICLNPDVAPSFPGGLSAQVEFVAENLQYPLEAYRDSIQGIVVVSFIVEPDGSLSDISVNKGLSLGCDLEAMRLISSMPKWVPAKKNKKKVRTSWYLPISFHLSKEKREYLKSRLELYDMVKAEFDREYLLEVDSIEGKELDVKPSFPGGEKAYVSFVKNNLKYPVVAQESGVQGRVLASFIVNSDGSINDITILEGLSKECDDEVIRVIQLMPKWTPGEVDEKIVAAKCNLGINFRFKGSGENSNVKALYLLNGKVITQEEALKIPSSKIGNKTFISDKKALKRFGEAGKYKDGIIVITLKK